MEEKIPLKGFQISIALIPGVSASAFADDLTQEQIKAFRLADNKVSEFSGWDFDELYSEVTGIMDINMSDFGFDFSEPDLSGIEFNETPAEQKEPDKKTIVCPKCGEVIEI